MSSTLAALDDALAAHGLRPRGGFAIGGYEGAPPGMSGRPARAVLLVGHGGPGIWPHFSAWRARQGEAVADPLDAWSHETIGAVAAAFGARAAFPFEKPYLPFQQWAMRAEGLKPSPLGILMHPEFGLWHAYRGALLFDDGEMAAEIARAARPDPVHLCDACEGKPCLRACPVGAYSPGGFDFGACLDHVRSPAGGACRTGGCLDRNACPYAAAYRYPAQMQAFHQRAFAKLAV